MDYKTGVVGVKRGISWQSLKEAIYIEPAPGIRKPTNNSKGGVRGIADGLIRAGLIISKSRGKQLIFECLLAQTDKSEKNKVSTKSAHQVSTCKTNNGAEFIHKVSIPKIKEVSTPPIVRYIKTTTTTEPTELVVVVDDNLIFSEKLDQDEKAAIKQALSKANLNLETKQDILDEFAGHLNNSNKPIGNKVGYFRKILQSGIDGTFTKERALTVQSARQKQKAIQQQIKSSNEKELANIPTEKRQKSKPRPEHLAKLKEFSKQQHLKNA